MKWAKHSPVVVLIAGTALALVIVAITFLFLNTAECPADYTQQQVGETGCVVGANIGFGLGILASIAIEVCTILATLVMVLVGFLKRKH